MRRTQLCSFLLALVVFGSEGANVKRQGGEAALAAVVQQLSADLQQMKAQLEAQKQEIAALKAAGGQSVSASTIVAFTVYPLDNDHGESDRINASTGALIPLHGVLTNIGGAFNVNTSTFVAPVDGVYYLALSFDCSHDYANGLHVIKNGEEAVLDADKDDSNRDHISAAGTLQLVAGDRITLVHADHKGYVDTGSESTFAGFLVK